MNRSLESNIIKDLAKKMVFLVGPRQVGKTWLARKVMSHYSKSQYLNYDDYDDRKIIESKLWARESELIVLDEIHKMPQWKNFIKGAYDTKLETQSFLITGSARLETFRQSGDSLAGRFFSFQLLPITMSEIIDPTRDDFDLLLERGGFPEPFLAESVVDANRWRMQYTNGLIRTDILDFENIHDLKSINLLFKMLRKNVSSVISYSSLARDLQISPATVKKYINIFESLFIIFMVRPYSKNIARSILKDHKIYFFDTGLVDCDDGAAFENMIAVELYKRQQSVIDLQGLEASLMYLKTKDKKEVDFCLVENGELDKLIEVKLSDKKISETLRFFSEKYDLDAIQLVKNLQSPYQIGKIKVANAFDWLT